MTEENQLKCEGRQSSKRSKADANASVMPDVDASKAIPWCTFLFQCMTTCQDYGKKLDEKAIAFADDLKKALQDSLQALKASRGLLENAHMAGVAGKEEEVKTMMEDALPFALSNT